MKELIPRGALKSYTQVDGYIADPSTSERKPALKQPRESPPAKLQLAYFKFTFLTYSASLIISIWLLKFTEKNATWLLDGYTPFAGELTDLVHAQLDFFWESENYGTWNNFF